LQNSRPIIIGRLSLVEKALSFTHELSFLFFNLSIHQTTVLSSHAVDGHQMYFGASVVGISFNNWYRNLVHPYLNFHSGCQKVRNLASLNLLKQIFVYE